MSTRDHRKSASTPERLAYWYFRLNGFMSIENFLVHPEYGSDIRTDADLLAVRFVHRRENVCIPMEDDPQVAHCETFANVVIAEIKTGRCDLNGPWTDPMAENMERVLRAVGCVEPVSIPRAADQLYEMGRWRDNFTTVRLLALGEWRNNSLPIALEQQVTWNSVIDFCIDRFDRYRTQKSATGQWGREGIQLRRLALSRDAPLAIRDHFGLRLPQSHDSSNPPESPIQ